MPFTPRLPTLALLAIFSLPAASADDPFSLRLERNFTPIPEKTQRDAPIFVDADRIEGETEKVLRARGKVVLRQRGLKLETDALDYDQAKETVEATGNVVLNKDGDIARGPHVIYNLKTETGAMESPQFILARKQGRAREGRGAAAKVVFEGPERDRLFDTTYTTCPTGNDAWFVRARELELDRTTQIGGARDATVVFQDVPIVYLPFLDFPLNNQRKSGFLPPTVGTTGNSGLELAVPWYWNIAPNYDATIMPRLLSKRGLQLNGEFRYLERGVAGAVNGEYLPNDNQRGIDRYLAVWRHQQTLLPGLGLTLDLQKASDDDYFRDLSTSVRDTSQIYLPRDGTLAYTLSQHWLAKARVLRYQTLQDANAPVEIQYFLEPQLSLAGDYRNVGGFDTSLNSEWVRYTHPTKINAERFILNPSLSYPMRSTWGYVTPKLNYHFTRYTYGENNTEKLPDETRSVPIASVDSALFFDRDLTLGGRAYRQTLEPRAFYVYAPFRDQSRIPNFATSELDFGFAQIFMDNPFVGGDRIADANQITLAAASRLIDAESGAERIRAVLAQRYYFTPQRVTLSGPSRPRSQSDLLAGLSGQITDSWSLDSGWQYSTDLGHTEKWNIGARYRPEFGKVLNVSYRFTRGEIRQIDASTQWPVTRNWQLLARANYSLLDSKFLEGLLGVEYNEDCWALRLVLHRFPTALDRFTNSFFVQLEFTGLSALGINPLDALRQNIPGYLKSSEIAQ